MQGCTPLSLMYSFYRCYSISPFSLNFLFIISSCRIISTKGLPVRSCPHLRHLILTGFRHVIDPHNITPEIWTLTPSVTHLFVPMDTVDIWVFLLQLKDEMDGGLMNAFPRILEHLVVHILGHWLTPWNFKECGQGDQGIILVPRP